MKVARWVREETVGKGLSPGNHLKHQAGRDSISTSLAVYFMPNAQGNSWDTTKGNREYRREPGKGRVMRRANSEERRETGEPCAEETCKHGSGEGRWKRAGPDTTRCILAGQSDDSTSPAAYPTSKEFGCTCTARWILRETLWSSI
ncbi:hypothetical protein [Ktedonobacter racemifer]|uniref:hypothetical protein n=1 Tax=Ktedonobacter racemifer TaxID=363277 RepID=UPI000948C0DC|nr:hypothetical protein [Ktedonobacter racemifer]